MDRKDLGLYEEPTTYRYDYVPHSLEIRKKSEIDLDHENLEIESEGKVLRLDRIRANDTFQQLDYDSRLPFNALWEPKESISIDINPSIRKQYLKDENLEVAIKTRPRVYMAPGISLDNVNNPETRDLMMKFTYTTTSGRASREVWRDFEPLSYCPDHKDLKNLDEPVSYFSKNSEGLEFQGSPEYPELVRRWDVFQDRGLIPDDLVDRKSRDLESKEDESKVEASEENIRSLVEKNKLSTIYDKFPSSYGGFRSCIALGVPLEKKELPVVHPNLTVSQAIHKRKD